MAQPLKINVEGDPSGLRKALGLSVADVKKTAAQIAAEKFEIKLDADIRAAETKIAHTKEQLDELRRRPASVRVDADVAAAEAKLAALDIQLDRLRKQRVDINVDVDSRGIDRAHSRFKAFGDGVNRQSVIAAAAIAGIGIAVGKMTAAIAIASAGPLLVTFAHAVVQAGGAIALLPAVAVAAAGAFAALKIATLGFGDALKGVRDPAKFAEAVKKLAPAARDTAVAVRDMVPAFDRLQLHVQQQLFAGLAGTVRQLGGVYLPSLTHRLGGVAAAMSLMAQSTAGALLAPAAVIDVNRVLERTAAALRNLAPAIADLIAGLLKIGRVGAEFLPGLAQGAADAAAKFREWATAAAASGQVHDIIARALAVIGDLGRTVANVGGIIRGVFASVNADGAGLIATLAALTATAVAWVNSAAGQEKIRQIFDSLSKVAASLLQVLPHFAGALSTVVGWFSRLPGPVQTVIGQFIGWSALIGPIVGKLSGLIVLLSGAGPKMLTAATSIGSVAVKLGGLGLAAATHVGTFVTWLATAALATARHVGTMLLDLGRWAVGVAVQGAKAVASLVVAALTYVGQWVVMAAAATAHAAVMAAAWLVALGPIGWAVAAVVALVALVVLNWDTVKRVTVEAWNAAFAAVSGAVSSIGSAVAAGIAWVLAQIDALRQVPERVGQFFAQAKDAATAKLNELVAAARAGGASLVSTLAAAWNSALASARSAWNSMVATVRAAAANLLAVVRAIPGQVLSALSGLANLLVSVGGDLVGGLVRGIQARWSWLIDTVRNLASAAFAAAKSALGIGSPSKVFKEQVGSQIVAGMVDGILAGIPMVEASVQRLADAARTAAMSALAGVGTVEVSAGGLRVSAGTAGVSVTGAGAGQADLAVELRAIRELLERHGAGAQITVEDRSGDPAETARAVKLALRLA